MPEYRIFLVSSGLISGLTHTRLYTHIGVTQAEGLTRWRLIC